ncbi:hypothetical protein SDC9_123471 [bioreactor metagenome]|uniref:Uncharacterized protein n=1 Tax=bioreactor metagenome TaxID=1076179 RepID=A0A645CHP5_9ZZZZ
MVEPQTALVADHRRADVRDAVAQRVNVSGDVGIRITRLQHGYHAWKLTHISRRAADGRVHLIALAGHIQIQRHPQRQQDHQRRQQEKGAVQLALQRILTFVFGHIAPSRHLKPSATFDISIPFMRISVKDTRQCPQSTFWR